MAVAGEGRGSMEKQSMDDASRDDNSSNSSLMNRLRRPVMRRLRYEGYNAAVCKSRWSHRDGVPAGRNQDPWNHHHLRLSFIIIIICLPSSSSLIFGPSQEFLSRRSECLSTSLDISARSSHGITVPSFEMSFCGKPSSESMMMFGHLPQEPDVRPDILCSECSAADTSGTTSSISGLSYDGDSSSFDDIAHAASQEHDACIAPDSFHTMSQGHSITNSSSELIASSDTVFLPQKPGLGSSIPPPMPGPVRCLCCRKKLGLLGFKCRCGDLFCALHRYSDKHNCRFDYRTAAKEAIAKANPVVKAPKIWKL